MGDSMIAIEWLKKKGDLKVASLEVWKERIIDLCTHFSSISFDHIFREKNQEVDYLSKLAFHND
jgi:hypothetical protein